VLERVPAAAATRALAPLRRALAANPHDLETAIELARGYLDLGRRNADPRFISYAQATLAPWLRQGQPPSRALVLEATALQTLHRFDAALTLLDRALNAQPGDGQAWLTRATILQVQGRLAEARQSCARLVQTADQLVAIACLAGVNGLNGRLAASYGSLRAVFTDDPRLPLPIRAWILGLLGEMAERQGETAQAETYFRAALRANTGDSFLKAAYADFLLAQRREHEVIALLRDSEAQDILLLRLAIAGQRTGLPEAGRWADIFEARFRAARRDGDYTHLREQARFLLEIRHEPAGALALAEENWNVEREPADAWIYLAAARAAKAAHAQTVVRNWLRETRLEDARLALPTQSMVSR
jgi:tetratricopeptide (TPR) repeat protein